MNPEQLKNDAEAYEKKSLLILGVSFVLMILPVLVLIPLGREKALELLADLLITQGFLVGILLFFSSMIPGLFFLILSKRYLEKNWKAKPETTCPHCQNFLLSANHFTAETGHCYQCGEKLMEVEPPEVTHPDLPVIPEDRKLEIAEVRKSEFQLGVCLICSFVVALSVLFYILHLMNYNVEGDEDPLVLLFIFCGGLSFFTILALSVHYFEKKYPFHCPACEKKLSGRTQSLTRTHRCPFCDVEIVKKPEIEDESKTVRIISPKELIRISYLCQKYLNITFSVWCCTVIFVLIPAIAVLSHRETGIPEWVLGQSMMILFFSLPFSIIFAEIYYTKHLFKKYKMICWNCGKSLLIRSIKGIVQSGDCPSCGQKVLEED